MTETTPGCRQPTATRPWWTRARCAACRHPLGRRDALVVGFPSGAVLLVHEACANPQPPEAWS